MTLCRNYIPMKLDTAVKEPLRIKIFLCLTTDKFFSCIPSQKKKQSYPSPLFSFTMYLSFSLPNSSSGSETMVKNMAVAHYQLDIKILWGTSLYCQHHYLHMMSEQFSQPPSPLIFKLDCCFLQREIRCPF